MEREIDRFPVRSEKDGRIHTAIEYAEIVSFRPMSGQSKEMFGKRRLALSDGRDLNPIKGDPEAFQIFRTDEIVRKFR